MIFHSCFFGTSLTMRVLILCFSSAVQLILVHSHPEHNNDMPTNCSSPNLIECCEDNDNDNCKISRTFDEGGDCFCNHRCYILQNCCPNIEETCPRKLNGSCVESGFKKCCNSSNYRQCQARDGACFCNDRCHTFGNCCEDIRTTCPRSRPSDKRGRVRIILGVTMGLLVMMLGILAVVITILALKRKKKYLVLPDRLSNPYKQDSLDDSENYYHGFDTVGSRISNSSQCTQTTLRVPKILTLQSCSPSSLFPRSQHTKYQSSPVQEKDSNMSLPPSYPNTPEQDQLAHKPFLLDSHYETEEDLKKFWEPADEEEDLRLQLVNLGIEEIPMTSLELHEELGCGEFGTVYRAMWQHSDSEHPEEVAVKSMKVGASEEERIKFLQEAVIMGQFNCPQIVQVLGINTDSEDCLFKIVMNMMHNGDLQSHLVTLRPNPSSPVPAELGPILLSYSRQVSCGLMYLSVKKYVHRDLAARNILVSADGICKIADFGLSRDLQDESYYLSHGGMIPVKWTAPEALFDRKYSTASDVWSLGCVLYEIWSLGCKPFQEHSNAVILSKIESGYRLPPPPGCPRAVYSTMIECWHPKLEARPTPGEVVASFSHPDFQILNWTTKDVVSFSKMARSIGAPLKEGHDLFPELQHSYAC